MDLVIEELTPAAFAPYGDVLQIEGSRFFHINDGKTERYHDLAKIEVSDGNRVLASINRAEPCDLPMTFSLLEKHPLVAGLCADERRTLRGDRRRTGRNHPHRHAARLYHQRQAGD